MARVDAALDRYQRRTPLVGVPLAIVYKYADDQGNYLAAMITYYAFIAIFPLLLLSSSILGFVLQGDPGLQEDVLNSALSQFPIIGDQLGRPEGLTGSTAAAVVGGLAALYGSLGLGQALQNAMNVAWAVPRNSRPNPVLLRLKSLLLLVSAGLAVLALSVFSALSTATDVLDERIDGTVRVLIHVATLLLVAAMLSVAFRFTAARQHSLIAAVPGALTVAVLWQGLQLGGALFATRVIAGTSGMNATFGLVLGLIGIIYIASAVAVLGMEVNVVLARRLWPRALLAPFTEAVELTEADRRAYALYARAQRHKRFQTVAVSFEDGHEED
jgi:membrane protein